MAPGGIRPRLSIVSHSGLEGMFIECYSLKTEDKGVAEWSHVKSVILSQNKMHKGTTCKY